LDSNEIAERTTESSKQAIYIAYRQDRKEIKEKRERKGEKRKRKRKNKSGRKWGLEICVDIGG